LIINILLLLSSAFCFVYGLCKYFGKRAALFCVLVIGAFGCFMMGHLYEFLSQLFGWLDPTIFNIGMLARIGGFAFIFSASFAQMDGLVDDRTDSVAKYRALALLAPAAMALLYVPAMMSDLGLFVKVIYGIVFLFGALAAYYNLKHLIIPDVSFGIIASIRLYSLLSLVSTLCYGLMFASGIMGSEILSAVFASLLAITYPCTVIAMEKGRQKWTS